MNFVPAVLVVVALVGRLVAAIRGSGRRGISSAIAWGGVVVGAVLLGWGESLGVGIAPVGVGLAMAAGAGLVAIDGFDIGGYTRVGSEVGAGVAAAGLVTASFVSLAQLGAASWPEGAVLLAAHWCAIGAAVAAASGGFGAVVASIGFGDETNGQPSKTRNLGHRLAARAVGFLWLGWAVAQLVHWRFLGVPGIGSRAEWFGLGVSLLASGCYLAGIPSDTGDFSPSRAAASAVSVFVVVAVGVGLAFGFGSPLQLAVGA